LVSPYQLQRTAVGTAVADMEVVALVTVEDTSAATILEDSLEVVIIHQVEFRIMEDLHTAMVMVADMAVATPAFDLDLEAVGATHREP
jgi:hypothetical protein